MLFFNLTGEHGAQRRLWYKRDGRERFSFK
jgi:hypothetical protein